MRLDSIRSEAVLAEFIGTFALTFSVLLALHGSIPLIIPPIAAAITLATFILLIGTVSGAHLNPAVTLGLYSIRKIDLVNSLAYIASQLSGAVLAIVALSLFQGNGELYSLGSAATAKEFYAETLGGFMFGFGIAAAIINGLSRLEGAIAIGLSLFIGISFASIASNGVINPAVALGIGSSSWPYVFGPIFGVFLGVNTYNFLLTPAVYVLPKMTQTLEKPKKKRAKTKKKS